MIALAVNLVLATIWLLLSQTPSPTVFAVGFFLGFALVALFRKVLDGEAYVRRCLAFLKFLLIFTREFLLANLKVAGVILFRTREALHPNFLTYEVAGLTRFEILLLSYCVSLTPGTTTVRITDDFQTLIIHALNAEHPARIRAGIDRRLKQPILRFTR